MCSIAKQQWEVWVGRFGCFDAVFEAVWRGSEWCKCKWGWDKFIYTLRNQFFLHTHANSS